MAFPTQWFSNRGQIVQVASATLTGLGVIGSLFAKAPTWLIYVLIGFTVGVLAALLVQTFSRSAPAPAPVPVPQEPEKPESALRFEKAKFVADNREEISYKRKLYVTFHNVGDTPIVIGPRTTWKQDGLHVKTVNQHLWQIEGPSGYLNDDWTKEADRVVVPPGRRTRTWVGLPGDANEREVDAYVSGRRAGALVTCVTLENITELRIAP